MSISFHSKGNLLALKKEEGLDPYNLAWIDLNGLLWELLEVVSCDLH